MDKLVLKIRELLDENEVNFGEVQRILEEYKSEPKDWRKFTHFDEHKYTRNLVDAGNGKYNLMILCWGPGMGSSIHDHSAAQCFVKVLDGQLLETRFAWPKKEKEEKEEEEDEKKKKEEEEEEEEEEGPMRATGTELFKTNGVSYISDKIGLHRMENPSHVDPTVTLHLYIPPYSQCYSFDQRTGRKQQNTSLKMFRSPALFAMFLLLLIVFQLFGVGIVQGSKRSKGRARTKESEGISNRGKESAKEKVDELEGKKTQKKEEEEQKEEEEKEKAKKEDPSTVEGMAMAPTGGRRTRREGGEVKKPREDGQGIVTLRRAPGELGEMGTKKKHREEKKRRIRRRHHSEK
ncbi:hypothetical protein niasHS_002633 [Heterodera schachtii]|uniref:Cysteine dioxygenase n=1 Tax=Heterodera schachtii TaxID=97005 RepID=A0ABD2K1Z9_HETSC